MHYERSIAQQVELLFTAREQAEAKARSADAALAGVVIDDGKDTKSDRVPTCS